jgi:hypothetical protein
LGFSATSDFPAQTLPSSPHKHTPKTQHIALPFCLLIKPSPQKTHRGKTHPTNQEQTPRSAEKINHKVLDIGYWLLVIGY